MALSSGPETWTKGGDSMEKIIAILIAYYLTHQINGGIDTFAALVGLFLVFYEISLNFMRFIFKLSHRILK